MKLPLPRRAAVAITATATALITAVAVAAPASASPYQELLSPLQGSIKLDGAWSNAMRYYTEPALTYGDSQSDITLTIDDRGGWQFSGMTVNNNWTKRHQQTSCTIMDRNGNTVLFAQTSDYVIGARSSKRWNWDRQWSQRVRDKFYEIRYTSRAFCLLDVS
ncbi:hypothetical protein ACIB24_06515 [Spongisporangium articulatum]|uniref:Uncharacterized protein n=1 Tax=Spongisporangium articulatum TaxID=3362603 RepID=A0ABW8AM55_9ACTN